MKKVIINADVYKDVTNESNYGKPSHLPVIEYLDAENRLGQTTLLTPNFFHNILLQGDCVVLMDGMGEVSENIDKIAGHIRKFIEFYSKNKPVLSCRP